MEENKMNYDKLKDLMDKIDEAMKMSNQQLEDINNKNQELFEETRSLAVEKGKEEIEQMESGKQEFDEMTVNSLVSAMQQLYAIRESSEKEYQEMLQNTLQRNQKIDELLKSKKIEFAQDNISQEELTRIETIAEKSKQKLNDGMQKFEEEHFKKRAELDKWENSIKKYGIDLNAQDKLDQVVMDMTQPEKKQSEQKQPEQDKTEQERPEQKPSEQDKTEQEQPEQKPSEQDKAEPKQPEQKPSEQKQPEQKQPEQDKLEPKPIQERPIKQNQLGQKQSVAKIKEVEFFLDNTGKIGYQVAIETSKGNYSYERLDLEDCASKMSKKQAKQLRKDEITRPKKYYDVNLATLLQQVDEKYGTNGVKQYNTMMQTKNKNDITRVTNFNISYDLSNINDTSPEQEENLKYIKKIAKANYKKGLVSYMKQPNWFTRLKKQLTSPKLGPANEPHETTRDDIEKAFDMMSQEPEFELEQFKEAYGLSDEEMKIYNEKYANIKKEKENPTSGKVNDFKERLAYAKNKVSELGKKQINNEPEPKHAQGPKHELEETPEPKHEQKPKHAMEETKEGKEPADD